MWDGVCRPGAEVHLVNGLLMHRGLLLSILTSVAIRALFGVWKKKKLYVLYDFLRNPLCSNIILPWWDIFKFFPRSLTSMFPQKTHTLTSSSLFHQPTNTERRTGSEEIKHNTQCCRCFSVSMPRTSDDANLHNTYLTAFKHVHPSTPLHPFLYHRSTYSHEDRAYACPFCGDPVHVWLSTSQSQTKQQQQTTTKKPHQPSLIPNRRASLYVSVYDCVLVSLFAFAGALSFFSLLKPPVPFLLKLCGKRGKRQDLCICCCMRLSAAAAAAPADRVLGTDRNPPNHHKPYPRWQRRHGRGWITTRLRTRWQSFAGASRCSLYCTCKTGCVCGLHWPRAHAFPPGFVSSGNELRRDVHHLWDDADFYSIRFISACRFFLCIVNKVKTINRSR